MLVLYHRYCNLVLTLCFADYILLQQCTWFTIASLSLGMYEVRHRKPWIIILVSLDLSKYDLQWKRWKISCFDSFVLAWIQNPSQSFFSLECLKTRPKVLMCIIQYLHNIYATVSLCEMFLPLSRIKRTEINFASVISIM